MDTTVDYYAVLGVPEAADRAEIKAAWSGLVQKFHPDMGDEADPSKFIEVQKAFEVLGDEQKRADYDRARDTHPPAAPPAEEDYSPGWGEAARPSRAAAAPSEPTATTSRSRTWVPPHLREETPVSPRTPEATPQSQAPAAPEPVVERPRTDENWRLNAQDDEKPRLVRGWKSLWLPPAVGMGLSVLLGLLAMGAAAGGVVGALTPVFVTAILVIAIVSLIIDWVRIQSGRESILGLAIVSIAALPLVFLGFSQGNFWLALHAAAASAAVGYFANSLDYKYIATRQLPAKQLRKYVAFGKPGKFAPTNVIQAVEQSLADQLTDLFRIPALRMFHGMSVPATRGEVKSGEAFRTKYGAQVLQGGYIGQAITAGKKVAFLTSVAWPGGRYALDSYGGVLIDGQHTQFDLEAFNNDLEHWAAKLKSSGAEVRHFVVVHSDGPVSFDMGDLPVELVSVDDIVDTVGTWLVEERTLDRKLNATIAEHLAAA